MLTGKRLSDQGPFSKKGFVSFPPQTEPFTLFPSAFPLVPTAAPTISAVLAVTASWPRLTSLALPGLITHRCRVLHVCTAS